MCGSIFLFHPHGLSGGHRDKTAKSRGSGKKMPVKSHGSGKKMPVKSRVRATDFSLIRIEMQPKSRGRAKN